LAQLPSKARGARYIRDLSPLTIYAILRRADEYHKRTGNWPSRNSGRIAESGGDTWRADDFALRAGIRSLPLWLARLLAERRDLRSRKGLLGLTEQQIVACAGSNQERPGEWPPAKSGPIAEVPGKTWTAVDLALKNGLRGSPCGTSLAILLIELEGVRNVWTWARISIGQVPSLGGCVSGTNRPLATLSFQRHP